MRLIGRDDPNVEVFANYAHTLDALGYGTEPVEPILRRFEKSMLDACGYGLQLSVDVESGAPVEPTRDYYYVVEQGPMHAHNSGRGILVQGSTLLALDGRGEFLAPQLKEAKRLMRFVLHHYIGDRPLASRSLFRGPGTLDAMQ
jgi:DNA repair protein RecO (recombination protein O)